MEAEKYITGKSAGGKQADTMKHRIKWIFAVKRGRKTGIFSSWGVCRRQLAGHPDPEFRRFPYRSELEAQPEDVRGSLRYAIRQAIGYLDDLIYLGPCDDYILEDPVWKQYGFLPFGNDPTDFEQIDFEELAKECDEAAAAHIDYPARLLDAWDDGADPPREPLGAWDDGAAPSREPLGAWDDSADPPREPLGAWDDGAGPPKMSLGAWEVENAGTDEWLTDCINIHDAAMSSWDAGDQKTDEWLTDCINIHDAAMKRWDVGVLYWKFAAEMKRCVECLRYGRSDADKSAAAAALKAYLERCIMDDDLNGLTGIYKDKKAANAIGYDPPAVAQFVTMLVRRYPEPVTIAAEGKRFDLSNPVHRDALMALMAPMAKFQIPLPDGVALNCFADRREIRVDGKTLCTCFVQDENDEDGYYCDLPRNAELVNALVNGTPELLKLVLRKIAEG